MRAWALVCPECCRWWLWWPGRLWGELSFGVWNELKLELFSVTHYSTTVTPITKIVAGDDGPWGHWWVYLLATTHHVVTTTNTNTTLSRQHHLNASNCLPKQQWQGTPKLFFTFFFYTTTDCLRIDYTYGTEMGTTTRRPRLIWVARYVLIFIYSTNKLVRLRVQNGNGNHSNRKTSTAPQSGGSRCVCVSSPGPWFAFSRFYYSTNGYFRFACTAATIITFKFHNDNGILETNQVDVVLNVLNA